MSKPISFLKEVHSELKQVVWPKKEEVVRLTLIVITISVIVGIYIGALDFLFTKTIEFVLR